MPTAMKSDYKKVHHVNYFLPVLRHKSTTEKNKNISARAHKKSAEFPNWIASPHDRRIRSFRFNEHGSQTLFIPDSEVVSVKVVSVKKQIYSQLSKKIKILFKTQREKMVRQANTARQAIMEQKHFFL